MRQDKETLVADGWIEETVPMTVLINESNGKVASCCSLCGKPYLGTKYLGALLVIDGIPMCQKCARFPIAMKITKTVANSGIVLKILQMIKDFRK